MGERKNTNYCWRFKVHDVVREARDGHTSYGQVRRELWHRRARVRPLCNLLESEVDRFEKLGAETGSPLFVPLDRFTQFSASFRLCSESTLHRSAR